MSHELTTGMYCHAVVDPSLKSHFNQRFRFQKLRGAGGRTDTSHFFEFREIFSQIYAYPLTFWNDSSYNDHCGIQHAIETNPQYHPPLLLPSPPPHRHRLIHSKSLISSSSTTTKSKTSGRLSVEQRRDNEELTDNLRSSQQAAKHKVWPARTRTYQTSIKRKSSFLQKFNTDWKYRINCLTF